MMKRRLQEMREGVEEFEPTKEELRVGMKRHELAREKSELTGAVKNAVSRVLEKEGFDPIEELLTLYRSGDLDDRDRAQICKELIPYLAPKMKQVDVNANVTGGFVVLLQDFTNPEKVVEVSG